MQPLLEVEGLKKTYPGFQLNGVSFSIYEDCITGFIGANGAGKTTCIRSIQTKKSYPLSHVAGKGKVSPLFPMSSLSRAVPYIVGSNLFLRTVLESC